LESTSFTPAKNTDLATGWCENRLGIPFEHSQEELVVLLGVLVGAAIGIGIAHMVQEFRRS
jgi:hypothetical protein